MNLKPKFIIIKDIFQEYTPCHLFHLYDFEKYFLPLKGSKDYPTITPCNLSLRTAAPKQLTEMKFCKAGPLFPLYYCHFGLWSSTGVEDG